MRDNVKEREANVERLLSEGQISDAMTEMLRLVIAYAKGREFMKAEAVRDRMLDVDAMALSEIIEAGEVIEREKSASIDQKHLNLWASFYSAFTDEERNALYFAMTRENRNPGDVLFLQGGRSEILYFLDSGDMKQVYQEKGVEHFVKAIRPGDVAGEVTFYKTTLCDSSLIAESAVTFHKLDRPSLERLSEPFPGVGPKLRDYCLGIKSAAQVLQNKGINRRSHERVEAQGAIVFQILNSAGKPASPTPVKGKLADISSGGISFYVHTTNGPKIRKLLGYGLLMKFVIPGDSNTQPVVLKGRVTGVLAHLDNEYSIHVKFDKLLDPKYFI